MNTRSIAATTLPSLAAAAPVGRARGSATVPAPRRRSITRKLALMVSAFVVAVAVMLTMILLAFELSVGVRAIVGAGGLRAAAQKAAVYHLTQYVHSRDDADFQRFEEALAIPLGARAARLEFTRPEFDYAAVEAGLVQAGNAARDVPNVVFVFRHFRPRRLVDDVLGVWERADAAMLDLQAVGAEVRAATGAGTLTAAQAHAALARIAAVDAVATPLQREFAERVSAAALSLRLGLRNVFVSLTVLLLGGGLWLAWRITADMRGRLRRIQAGIERVEQGDLSHPIALDSDDELGELATAFDAMVAHRREAADKAAQRALELERSNAELEQFAYVASHDLIAPLRGIRGFVQLLERRLKPRLDAQAEEYLQLTLRSVDQMQALTAGLLALSRIGRDGAPPVPVDLGEVLQQVRQQLAAVIAERDVKVEVELLPVVRGVPVELHQLFQNLVANAIKFQPGAAPRVHVSAWEQDGSHWVVSVRDWGIGVDPVHRDKVFQLFQRLNPVEQYEGSGIGLAICQKIAQRHGGRCWVEPAEGGGSVFKVLLKG